MEKVRAQVENLTRSVRSCDSNGAVAWEESSGFLRILFLVVRAFASGIQCYNYVTFFVGNVFHTPVNYSRAAQYV